MMRRGANSGCHARQGSVIDDPVVHALAYARLGWYVIPTVPGEKRPRIKGWQAQATVNGETIQQWWQKWPDSGVAIVTGPRSGVFVVDVDPQHGGTLDAVVRRRGALPVTPEVITGQGGRHIYLAVPPGHAMPANSSNKIATGVDVRGEGGLVIAPPSLHANGAQYQWRVNPGTNVAYAPLWLMQILERQPVKHRQLSISTRKKGRPPKQRHCNAEPCTGRHKAKGYCDTCYRLHLQGHSHEHITERATKRAKDKHGYKFPALRASILSTLKTHGDTNKTTLREHVIGTDAPQAMHIDYTNTFRALLNTRLRLDNNKIVSLI